MVLLPSQYAFAERPLNASAGVDGAEVSTLAVFEAADVPWLPTLSERSSR